MLKLFIGTDLKAVKETCEPFQPLPRGKGRLCQLTTHCSRDNGSTAHKKLNGIMWLLAPAEFEVTPVGDTL